MITKTADEYRAEAKAKSAEAEASFERCDTDGFMSQWASQLGADLARRKATLAEQGNTFEFSALFDLEGNVASTHLSHGDYGFYYVLNDEAAEKFGRRFVSPSMAQDPKREHANNAKKGFAIGTIRVAAYADMKGASITSVSAVILPDVLALKSGLYEIVSTDNFRDDRAFVGF